MERVLLELSSEGSAMGNESGSASVPGHSERFYNIMYITGCWTGGICSVVATLFAIKLMWGHLKKYEEPELQRPIVRIILFIPIYAIDSLFSLLWPSWAMIFDTTRDIYEAYVIYIFYMLMVKYIELSGVNLQKFLAEQPRHKHPAPLCCFYFNPGGLFSHTCKQMILQYTVLKPILAFVSILCELTHTLHEGSFSPRYAYLYLVMIENVSVTLALYYLVLFYMVTHEPLESFRPVAKFLCVKMVIFFTFWQSVVIGLLVYFDYISEYNWGREGYFSTALNDWLICVEMLFFSLAFGYAFGVKTYRDLPQSASKQVLHQISSILNPRKFKSDYSDFRRILSNFRDVLSQKDMIEETVDAFGKKGRRWLDGELGDWPTIPLYQKRQRVLKEGPIKKKAARLPTYKTRYFVLLDSPKGLVYFDKNPFASATESDSLIAPNAPTYTDTTTTTTTTGEQVGQPKEEEEENDLLCPPLEFIPLSSIQEISHDEELTQHGWLFEIHTSGRNWILSCGTRHEREEWINSIRRATDAPKEDIEVGREV